MTPAEFTLAAFETGETPGARTVSLILGVHETTPYKWTYPRSRGGTDGVVPAKYHAALLEAAKLRKVPLTKAHLVLGDDVPAGPAEAA